MSNLTKTEVPKTRKLIKTALSRTLEMVTGIISVREPNPDKNSHTGAHASDVH